MSSVYLSRDDRRRDVVAARNDLNGIDFLEVHDTPALAVNDRQRTLFVHFINDPGALALDASNVVIEGGERIRNIRVTNARVVVDPRSGDTTRAVLVVEVDLRGDFSTYTLRLVESPSAAPALSAFDPVLRAIDFSFKVNCPSDFDCTGCHLCTPNVQAEPSIDYLARDFNSIRLLLLDRLAVIAPQWKDRSPADVGVALVELLAYVGDQLSYRQDAVATEAYIGTARRRISVRRHARLADYAMHDGCNARVWLQMTVDPTVAGAVVLSAGTQVLTAVANQPVLVPRESVSYEDALGSGAVAFETMHAARLFADHNTLRFYTWGARESCLPKGAVRATLRGPLPNLRPGDFLVFREVVSPRSGRAPDAAFGPRHVVKLIDVAHRSDPIGGQFDDPPVNEPREVTDIQWAPEDALPFALCISAELDDDFGGGFVEDVSLAYGNLVLADHGQTLSREPLPVVPRLPLTSAPAEAGSDRPDNDDPVEFAVRRLSTLGTDATEADGAGECTSSQRRLVYAPVRYRPTLANGPLTQAASFTTTVSSARAAFEWTPEDVLPAIYLTSAQPGSIEFSQPWKPVRDLLGTAPDGHEFVVEIDNDGSAILRFGDGQHGAPATRGTRFIAFYRVGNGVRGNVGAESLVHLVSDDSRITAVTNPMPARGGTEPETIEEVRQRAPFAFREDQKRAVTAADYARHAADYAAVQRAAGTLRWTGSWHTMFVSVDRLGGAVIDADFEQRLRAHLEPLRMAGVDLEVDRPRPVPLELVLRVCVHPDYFASSVEQALLEVFTSGLRADGRPGPFHPDSFSFGQTVYVSPWIAAAQAVPGVSSVEIETFQRRDAPGPAGKDAGFITVGRLEVPVLENNPNFPERGKFDVITEGGR